MQIKSILKALLIISVTLVLFAWSVTFYIHSSELWSIYISKNIFNIDFSNTILLKPLFHLALSALYLFPVNDVQHLLMAKSIFAAFGLLQVILMIEIFRHFFKEKPEHLSIPVALLLLLSFSSTNYLQNFFRIRTDQVCITIFLLALYLDLKNKLSLMGHVLFMIVYPMVGMKGLLFTILHSLHLATSRRSDFFKNKKKLFYYSLIFFSFLIWSINIGWNSISYFIQTTSSFSQYFLALSSWMKTEWFLLLISLISLFNYNFQSFCEKKIHTHLSSLSLSGMILILLFPQKHTYFLASFSPIFILNTSAFFVYLLTCTALTDSFKKVTIVFISFMILAQVLISYSTITIYRSNKEELNFIHYISEVINLNNLSYVDGIGSLPRAYGMNCFVSPDDQISNAYCLELVRKGQPDVVILTPRLMGLIGPNELLDPNYIDSGYNIFFKKGLEYKKPKERQMQPALLIFGFEI